MPSIALKEIRKARGLKQSELAEKIGIAPSAIGHYETGARKIDPNKLTMLAQVLGVSTDEILGVKPVDIEESKKAVHGNSRTAQIQEIFDKLGRVDQRAILKQAKGLLKD